MNGERRNDIGTKVLISVVALLTVTIMGFSIANASKAAAQAQSNKIDISVLQNTQDFIRTDLVEIKSDIKEVISIVSKYK